MSRNLRTIGIILGAGVGAAYLAPKLFNPPSTPAAASIEARYTAAGASPSGERATATERGNQDSVYTPAESRNQERLREQKEDLLGAGNTQMPKGDNKVFGRAPPEDRPNRV